MKTLVLAALAAAAILAPVAPVAAASAAAPPQVGQVLAMGSGSVAFAASGKVELRLFGAGTLVIPDALDHPIQVIGQGQATVTPTGTLILQDFTGLVRTFGGGLEGKFAGGPLRLAAKGTGQAVVRGLGAWYANGQSGAWTPAGVTIRW